MPPHIQRVRVHAHSDVERALDIVEWLRDLGLERYAEAFRDNDVDAEILPKLTGEDLLAIGVTSVGHRRKLLGAIAALTVDSGTPPVTASAGEARDADLAKTEAERRQLTVMFVDLVGSTALSARLDPEDLRQVIRGYQNAVAGEVARFEGHVAKFMGDGVLAYFGWPRAHEDEAERAVRAGLAITAAVARLGGGGAPLECRVGIATGVVVVGDLVGEGAAQEQAVVGETPNLAARLQALAGPDGVVISQSTRRLVGGLFELTELGPQHFRGFDEPVMAWRVRGEGAAEGRFEALHGERLTPLVGREHEIALLLERWAHAKDADGQVVLLAGEPGIGKSRIVQALREQLEDEPHVRLRYFCSPYHTNSVLYPILDQLGRAAGFVASEPPEAKLAKLEALLRGNARDVAEAVALLAPLFSLPVGESHPRLRLSPQRQKQQALEVVIEQLEGLAAGRPVLMIFEDAQWIDPTTLELLDLIVDRIARLPVLLLITFRPEFVPPWTGHDHVTRLSLNRLSHRQANTMVERLTGGRALPAEVLDQILAKTDGVPLFVEELTKAVLESGLLRSTGDRYELAGPLPTLAIPATLQDSLMARLDRLVAVKEVAQVGAVIGREFSRDLLVAVAIMPRVELEAALEQLTKSDLVFGRGLPPHAMYAFKHALVRDVAYNSLLKSRRQELHSRIAQVLEERFPDAAPEMLAYHCDEAGLAERAAVCWQRAGTRALERSAIKEAIAHLSHGLASLVEVPPGRGRDDIELDIQIALASAHMAARGYAAEETERAYTRAHELLRGDDPRQFAVLYGLFVARWNWAQLHDALAAAEEMVNRAQKQRDPVALCVAHRSAAVAQNVLGEFSAARRNTSVAWECYDPRAYAKSALDYGHDIGVAALLHMALADWFLGFPERAWRSARQGEALAEELGHANTRGYAQFWLCWLHLLARDGPALAARAEALVGFADEQVMAFWAAVGRALLGAGKTLAGAPENGIELLDSSIAEMERARTRCLATSVKGAQAEALAQLGRRDEGQALLQETLDLARDTGLHWYEAENHRLLGMLFLQSASPDREAAQACFSRAIDVARRQGARSLELRAATSLARLRADQGQRTTARDLLAPIYNWFTEGFDTKDLIEARALLEELR
jgi:class 3 adenylate cyclase/predicted ATPase